MATTNKEVETVRLDEKVKVRSLAPWDTGARRILSIGDISIPPNGVVPISREEIIAQAQSGNRFFNGEDGQGGHAKWYIEDAWTRKELGYEDETSPQALISDELIQNAFSLKTISAFTKRIKEMVHSSSEKAYLMDAIKRLKFNDYDKIEFCKQYTGINL